MEWKEPFTNFDAIKSRRDADVHVVSAADRHSICDGIAGTQIVYIFFNIVDTFTKLRPPTIYKLTIKHANSYRLYLKNICVQAILYIDTWFAQCVDMLELFSIIYELNK